MKKIITIFLFLLLVGCSTLREGSYRGRKKEFRGVWIATVANIDWPNVKGISKATIEKQKKEFIKLLDEAVYFNMNAVIVQVRPSADAFYPSSYAPWSKFLTGQQGVSPGWDPLKFMIRETHRRHLQFHAWFNPYRVTTSPKIKLVKNHTALEHKDWTFKYGGKTYYNPGVPEVMNYNTKVIMEVVKKYNIDGVHIDDYFYPYPIAHNKIPDYSSYKKYGRKFADIKEWRRNNVSSFIESLSKQIKSVKPTVAFGVSPFGVWRNKSRDKTGSKTRGGVENYDNLYANTRLWIEKEWIDYIVPQIYWNQGFRLADYNTLVDWWAKEVKRSHVNLYIGQAAYRVGGKKGWKNSNELINQIKYNRTVKGVKGSVFFSANSFFHNPTNIQYRIKKTVYRYKVAVPR